MKGLVAICSYPLYLNTRTPNVKSLKDFTETDKIAVPSVKVSTQAIMLQIQAEKEWGPGQEHRIDSLTVSLGHPDAMAALLGNTEVTAHFASSPFHEVEKKDPRIHTVMTSYEILGGQATAATLITSERFKKANPKTVQAVIEATRESIDYLNADKRRAAGALPQICRRQEHGRGTRGDHLRSGLVLHAHAAEDRQDRAVHEQDRHGEDPGDRLEAALLPRGARAAGGLSR